MSEFHRPTALLFMHYICYSNTACSVAGITSDANVLTTYLREVAQWLVEGIVPVIQFNYKKCAGIFSSIKSAFLWSNL